MSYLASYTKNLKLLKVESTQQQPNHFFREKALIKFPRRRAQTQQSLDIVDSVTPWWF